jgi:hypothetical protein
MFGSRTISAGGVDVAGTGLVALVELAVRMCSGC